MLLYVCLSSCSSDLNIVIAEPWIPPPESHNESTLFAFIGQKLSVLEFEPELEDNVILMDLAFKARYKLLAQVTGTKLPDIVEFEAYDHYGFPMFAKHDIALIYLTKAVGDDALYHVKYTFDRVRQTSDGRWAKCTETYGRDDKLILEPKRIPNIRGCKRGNYASEIVQARIAAGEFDYD